MENFKLDFQKMIEKGKRYEEDFWSNIDAVIDDHVFINIKH
jgi:hypothetical protein